MRSQWVAKLFICLIIGCSPASVTPAVVSSAVIVTPITKPDIMPIVDVEIPISSGRCITFVQPVRVEHTKYFGIQYPYWYGVGQLEAESNCRVSITAFDLGEGPAQFMPATSKYIMGLMGETLDPRNNPKHAIRMQAFYMNRIHTKENWSDRLWISYQIYNGGKGTLYNEYKRANQKLDWFLMKAKCQRKKIQFKWGILDLCTVNYDYSKKVEKYGKKYRGAGTDGMKYW